MSLRLFAGLEIPDAVAGPLLGLMRGVPGASWRPRENLHITLQFFGEMDERRAEDLDSLLAELANTVAPLALRLKGAGHFGGDKPTALYMGVAQDPGLIHLAQGCARAARRLGLRLPRERYLPHVTMAYLSGLDGAQGLDRVMGFVQRQALYESAPWSAEGFGLYSSHMRKAAPSLYRLEAAYGLMGKSPT
jgi:2'-5' RNA ligase